MPTLIWLNSIDELRSAASHWDDLWARSDVTMPTARAELVAQWVEQFTPGADFRALAVEDQGKWIAAIPLVGGRVRGVLSAGIVPVNAWTRGGGLLLDPGSDCDAALDLLLSAAREMPWQLLWLDFLPLASPAATRLLDVLARKRMAASVHPRFEVARIAIDHDWEGCQKSWSGKHRRGIRWQERRLADEGEVRFWIQPGVPREEVEASLRRGFEVENASWKGASGSSVFSRGMFPFFARQAAQLADWGHLRLCFLEVGGAPIAFCYGMYAKGVFHYCKIGYDPKYNRYSPGTLLICRILEGLYQDPDSRAFDFVGEMADSYLSWRPSTYWMGQVGVAPRRLVGRMAVCAHKHVWPHVRRIAKRLAHP